MLLKSVSLTNGRAGNQDSYISAELSPEGVVLAVCDGMGGLTNSELASAEVISAIKDYLTDCKDVFDAYTISDIVANIHRSIQESGSDSGTTFTYLAAAQHHYMVLHAGDSRAYHIKGNHSVPTPLTKDHTALDMIMQRYGRVDSQDVIKYRSTLVRAVGPGNWKGIDCITGSYEDGDSFLVCSDGFWHTLDTLSSPITLEEGTISDIAQRAIKEGERDNITAVGVVI